MGGALRAFLWLWREGRPGESPHVRQVRGGGLYRLEEIAQELGMPVRTWRRHLATLRDAGYLTTWREQPGFTEVASLWDHAQTEQQSRLAQIGHSHGHGARPAIFGQSAPPPAPPVRVLEELFLNFDSSRSCLYSLPSGFSGPPTPKNANVVPIWPGLKAPEPSAGAAAEQALRLWQEQAILHHLGRMGAWERPEFNRTLRETLAAVPLRSLAEVFEAAHFAARFRVGEVGNPAGWWVETLRPTAKECLEAVAEDSAHVQE